MMALAKEVKAKLEGFEGYSLDLPLDFFMDQLSEIAERKDYYSKQSWVKEGDVDTDRMKVYQIKDTQLLGNAIDGVDGRQYREVPKKQKQFKAILRTFQGLVRLVDNVGLTLSRLI